MTQLLVAEFMSLDGVIQAPGGPDEDPSGGFRFGGWQFPLSDEVVGADIMGLFAQPFELLLGRRTYDIWAAYWPEVAAHQPGHPIAGPFDRVRKHVATHRPDSLAWRNSHALRGDPASAVRALKAEGGPDLLTHGSGELVRQLLAAGLVDELRIYIYPVLLGRGRRLFGDDALPGTLSLTHSATSPSGVLMTRYRWAGEVCTGSFKAG